MGVPRPTEMTVRDLLQEELRKRGVTVIPEFSVSILGGRRIMLRMLINLNYIPVKRSEIRR